MAEIPAEEVIEAMRSHLDEKAEETVMTAAQRLIEKGRAEGRAKGCLEALLRRLLAARFGSAAADVEARLAAADRTTLDRWFDRALRAWRIEEVFDGD